MRLSVPPVSYFRNIVSGLMTPADWVREVSSLGPDASDISILFLIRRDRTFLEDFRRRTEAEDMTIIAAGGDRIFFHRGGR